MSAFIPAWHARALCRTEPGDWFADSPALVEQAKAVCGRCAVVAECLEDAVAREDPWGVQGGLSASERLAPLLLAEVEPVAHVPSRGCYVTNRCQEPECRAANTSYQAELRARAAATGGGKVDTGEQLAIGWEAAA